jgi:membrane-bound ClpP family serine protease
VAFAVSVAERRGRDVEFAEDSVRDGASVTASAKRSNATWWI